VRTVVELRVMNESVSLWDEWLYNCQILGEASRDSDLTLLYLYF
jgi:hypothetical protein